MSTVGSTLSPVAAAIAAVDELLPATLSGEVWRSSADELDQALGDIWVIEAKLAGLRIVLVRDADLRGLRERASAPDTVAWLRDRYGLDLRDARAEVEMSLCTRPGGPAAATGEALRSGRIGEAHARTMLALLEALPAPLPEEVVAEAEHLLLEVAAYGDSQALRSAGRDIAEKLTPVSEDGPGPREWELTNQLHLAPYEPGWWRLSGLLDAEHAAIIQAAIDAMAGSGRTPAPTAADARPATATPAGKADGADAASCAGTDAPGRAGHSAEETGTQDVFGSADRPRDQPPAERPTADTPGAAERRADALAELCADAVRDGRVPTHGGLPATIPEHAAESRELDPPSTAGMTGPCQRASGGPWDYATVDASSLVAAARRSTAMPITSSTGPRVARRIWRTSACSARTITDGCIVSTGCSRSDPAASPAPHPPRSTRTGRPGDTCGCSSVSCRDRRTSPRPPLTDLGNTSSTAMAYAHHRCGPDWPVLKCVPPEPEAEPESVVQPVQDV